MQLMEEWSPQNIYYISDHSSFSALSQQRLSKYLQKISLGTKLRTLQGTQNYGPNSDTLLFLSHPLPR